MTKPIRIQLSRRKGWRMPPNTVKVDRSTSWGNPAIVGINGNAAECVYLYILMACGYLCISGRSGLADRQQAAMKMLLAEKHAGYPTLRGKNLACWCVSGNPCHADILLKIANQKGRPRGWNGKFTVAEFMAPYGYRIINGKAERI